MLSASKAQVAVLVVGMLVLAGTLIYVPFEATYVQEGDNSQASIGYYPIWSPPGSVRVCVKTFGMEVSGRASNNIFDNLDLVDGIIHKANRRCHSHPVYSQVIASAAAVAISTLAFFLLFGSFRRRA